MTEFKERERNHEVGRIRYPRTDLNIEKNSENCLNPKKLCSPIPRVRPIWRSKTSPISAVNAELLLVLPRFDDGNRPLEKPPRYASDLLISRAVERTPEGSFQTPTRGSHQPVDNCPLRNPKSLDQSDRLRPQARKEFPREDPLRFAVNGYRGSLSSVKGLALPGPPPKKISNANDSSRSMIWKTPSLE